MNPPDRETNAEEETAGWNWVRRILGVLGSALFLLVLVRTGWMCDDAYIGLRTVDNFINGYGLSWNTVERVQAYTCPLWILLLSAVYAVTREPFYTSLLLSIGLSLSTFYIVLRSARSAFTAALAATILLLSKAYVDYSTSGLENPLTHLLIAGFFAVFLCRDLDDRRLAALGLLAGLGTLNRMDTILLFAPCLAFAAWESPRSRRVFILAAGFVPFMAWEFFALFYYGAPFPNTAYAKLGSCYAAADLVRQGGYYLLNSWQVDRITCVAIATALAIALAGRVRRAVFAGVGIALYLGYVVKVGGDFMSGRFLAAPLIASVMLIARADFAIGQLSRSLVYLSLVALGMLAPHPTLFCGADYEKDPLLFLEECSHGIGDERGVYYPHTSLLRCLTSGTGPDHPWIRQGLEARENGIDVIVKGNIGFFGYYAGPKVYIVDPGALTDPLLARLPAVKISNWRVGHYVRMIPDGYIAHLRHGEPLKDAKLARFNEKLSHVVRGPLFDLDRLCAIGMLNLGFYKDWIDTAYYQSPPCIERRLVDLEKPASPDRLIYISPNGLEVCLDFPLLLPSLELSLSSTEWFDLWYLNSDQTVAHRIIIPPFPPPASQFKAYVISPPEEARQKQCDRLRIVPIARLNDGSCQLGSLRLGR